MKRTFIILSVLLLTSPALSADMRATILGHHDGDTVFVRPEGDCLHPLFLRLSLRALGCDTPELHDKRPDMAAKAQEAKAFTDALLPVGTEITIKGVKWDKYGGRIDGIVEVDGADLCRLLMDAGLAREYHGQGSKPW